MTDAVIVSTARTHIGRAFRGVLNNTKSPTLAGHAIRAAVERAGLPACRAMRSKMSCWEPHSPPAPRA